MIYIERIKKIICIQYPHLKDTFYYYLSFLLKNGSF